MRNGVYLLPSRFVLLELLVKQLEHEAEPTAQSWSGLVSHPVADSQLIWDTWLDLKLPWHFETVFVVLVL